MYLIDRRTGKFHVIINQGHGLQRVCGGLIFLCVKTEPQPPDLPLCDRCRRKLKRREAVLAIRYIRSRNMLSTIDTVKSGGLLITGPKPVKPLPGQTELFGETEE